jgi:hypothetical protein
MRNSSYRNPAEYEAEPVFALRRPAAVARHFYPADRYSQDDRSGVVPMTEASLPREWPFESQADLESGIYPTLDDDDDELPVRPPSRARSIAVRFLGALVIGGAFYICGAVLTNPQAGKAVLGWLTMGHADQVTHVVERVSGAIRGLINGG